MGGGTGGDEVNGGAAGKGGTRTKNIGRGVIEEEGEGGVEEEQEVEELWKKRWKRHPSPAAWRRAGGLSLP